MTGRKTAIAAWAAAALAAAALARLARERLRGAGADEVWTEIVAGARSVSAVVRERGVLETRETVPVEMQTGGDISEIAKNGVRVSAGEVVTRLDERDLLNRVEELEGNIENARIDTEVNAAEYSMIEVRESNELWLAACRLEFARIEHDDAAAGLKPEDRRLLEIDREIARLSLEDARDELRRQERLRAGGFVSDAMTEPYARRVEVARQRLAECETAIELRAKGEPPERLLELRQRVRRHEAQLARGRKALDRQLEEVAARIRIGEARAASDRFFLAEARRSLSNSVQRAPCDGVFATRLFNDWRSGGQWMEYRPGVRVHRGFRVADMVNPGLMSVALMVNAADVGLLTTGMPAKVRLPAFGERTFDGTLVEVGGVGRDRFEIATRGTEDRESGVAVFNARVALDGQGEAFHPGMSAVVEFVIDRPAPKLLIPREAVRWTADGPAVLRRRPGGVRPCAVKGRVYDERYFLVEEGVAEGDRLLVGRRRGEGA